MLSHKSSVSPVSKDPMLSHSFREWSRPTASLQFEG